MNKVRSKDSKGFSSRNRKFKRFFRLKTCDLQKKKKKESLLQICKGFSGRKRVISKNPKNVLKSGVSPQKPPIWASICTPVAPSQLISSGHSPRLGGAQFSFGGHKQSFGGGHGPGMPPMVPGLIHRQSFENFGSLDKGCLKKKILTFWTSPVSIKN